MRIPFNKPYSTGKELEYMAEAISSGRQSGNNPFGKRVVELMKHNYEFQSVFLTPSCTAALEMGAMLANIKPGDEVILPSYTFSSTANAVVIFGAKPVFCEVSQDTMNIDVARIEGLITSRTKMIIPIDYAGVPCNIDGIMAVAKRYDLIVMQDCAQSYGSLYHGKATGTLPHLATFSFHETKNYSSGEGGALVVNVPDWIERASFLQEKGTDRTKVLNGTKERYSWIDKGSSYLLSDILGAMLLAQLESEDSIKQKRASITKIYRARLKPFVEKGVISMCHIGGNLEVNHHAFWILLRARADRDRFIELLQQKGISAYIGYVPLHSSEMGKKMGYLEDDLPITENLASRIVRLPFYTDLPEEGLEFCVQEVKDALEKIYM